MKIDLLKKIPQHMDTVILLLGEGYKLDSLELLPPHVKELAEAWIENSNFKADFAAVQSATAVHKGKKYNLIICGAGEPKAMSVDKLRRLFAAYVDHKGEQSVLDYDDLLLFWHGLLTEPRAARSIRSRFDSVLVDEYQDTNRLQAEILQMLCPEGKNLTVVGDDAQAIYSFRAATVRNILDFPEQFPDTRIVTLEQNYRSTQPILDATNQVIAGAVERHAKDLWTQRTGGARPQLVTCEDEDEQTEFVIRQILEHREAGLPLRRQAVLFRASHHSLALELELARRNIPFHKYGGLRFIETAHVKDLLAFLRLAENPRDLMAGTRVLMLLPGIGPKTAERLHSRAVHTILPDQTDQALLCAPAGTSLRQCPGPAHGPGATRAAGLPLSR